MSGDLFRATIEGGVLTLSANILIWAVAIVVVFLGKSMISKWHKK